MKTISRLLFFSLLFSFFFFILPPTSIFAQDTPQQLDQKRKEIEELEKKLADTAGKKVTLASTLEKINTKISLTQANIQKTQTELNILTIQIDQLSVKIETLEDSLEIYSVELLSKLQDAYKQRQSDPMELLLLAEGFNDFLLKYKYRQLSQAYTQKLLTQIETQKLDFDAQKQSKEDKQVEMEQKRQALKKQQDQLTAEQNTQKSLLDQTNNDEKQFQELLSRAKAEYESIQAIIRGNGEEVEVGQVKNQDKIATMIPGASCNSSGQHLHFTLADADGNPKNPFDYLRSVDHTNCSGRADNKCTPSDPFDPRGTWEWPVSSPVYMTQGYGVTWSISHDWVGQIYASHNGIDITGSSLDVKAVQDGMLYRGSYTGNDNCKLPYVRVRHNDGLNSFYLHVNY